MSDSGEGNPLLLTPVSMQDRDRRNDLAVAVVGCGLHSTTSILPSIRHAPMRLVAVCDLDGERAEAARINFGAEMAVQSVDELLASATVDAVLIVGPPGLHVSAGVAALEAGRHIFVEKPPGDSLAAAERLQHAAQSAGRQVMVGFMKRHSSAYRLVAQVMSSPDFGLVTSLQLNYSHWPVNGLRLHLTDMSIHALDTACWLLGEPLHLSVYKRPREGLYALVVTIEHVSGAVSDLHLSALQPGVQERLVLTGRQAVVTVDAMTRVEYIRVAAGEEPYQANRQTVATWAPEMTLPDRENDATILQGYATSLIAFANAIRSGQPVSPSIDDGVLAMRMVEAIAAAPEGLSAVELDKARD